MEGAQDPAAEEAGQKCGRREHKEVWAEAVDEEVVSVDEWRAGVLSAGLARELLLHPASHLSGLANYWSASPCAQPTLHSPPPKNRDSVCLCKIWHAESIYHLGERETGF